MNQPTPSGISRADFLAWEQQQADRFEWVDGTVVRRAGGSDDHAAINSNSTPSSMRPWPAARVSCAARTVSSDDRRRSSLSACRRGIHAQEGCVPRLGAAGRIVCGRFNASLCCPLQLAVRQRESGPAVCRRISSRARAGARPRDRVDVRADLCRNRRPRHPPSDRTGGSKSLGGSPRPTGGARIDRGAGRQRGVRRSRLREAAGMITRWGSRTNCDR